MAKQIFHCVFYSVIFTSMFFKLFATVHVSTDSNLAITTYYNWNIRQRIAHIVHCNTTVLWRLATHFSFYSFQTTNMNIRTFQNFQTFRISGTNSCSFVITPFVALQAVFVFVWQPPVADILQKEIGIPI